MMIEKQVLTRETYKPQHKGVALQLTPADAEAVAVFMKAPPQAALNFMGWIRRAKAFHGIFVDGKLAAIGSTKVALPEAWHLIAIET